VIKFAVDTPLGFRVRTTEAYWQLILLKHPEIRGKESAVEATLAGPTLVCKSRHDPSVHLFYRSEGEYYSCVVAKRINGDGFIVTAYVTDTVKEGAPLWPTSE